MSELRQFAETLYARPGVAAAALRLQEEWGADINLLLAAAWLAHRGEELTAAMAAALAEHCRPLRQRLLLPQRAVRRAVKEELPELYAQALALELALEYAQLDRMAAWVARQGRKLGEDGAALLASNLRAAMTTAAPAAEAWLPTLAELQTAMGELVRP